MPLQLKCGPKNKVWTEVIAKHRGDNDALIEDRFQIRTKVPVTDAEARADSLAVIRSMGLEPVTADELATDDDGEPTPEAKKAQGRRIQVMSVEEHAGKLEAAKQYLRDNIDAIKGLQDADGGEVGMDQFEDLISIPPYRAALVDAVMRARALPEATGKKS